MLKKTITNLAAALIVAVLALSTNAPAQNILTTATNWGASQTVVSSLSNLPDADELIYISPHRVLTEAAPRVLPDADLTKMRAHLSEMKKQTGIDPANIDFIVFQVRFKKPTAELNFSLPEYLAVASGDFTAETILVLIRQASGGKLRDEKYGSRTISLLTIPEIAQEAQKNSFLKPLSEIAIATIGGNTIVAGTPAYVRAAMDAADGKGRINADILNSLMRDPTALLSTAGSPMLAFAKTFALLGTENNPRASRCDSKLGDFYAGITMDATSFKLRGAMNADNPDTAKIIKSLLSSLLQQATSSIKDQQAQSVLSSLVITPTETEVLLQADISQQAVADFIREQAKPKKQEVSKPVPPKPATKIRHRTTRRRPAKSGV
jgi:hypothetical protein